MIKAPIPANEDSRLKALLDYEILDTVPEEDFDELTRTASAICKTPIALVSLIDTDRQWFKSVIGINAKESSREYSFCGHAINDKELFLVKDTLLDHRFADNPIVTDDLKVRFYAGFPLISPCGHAIGTLCVADQVPRDLSDEQRMLLSTLSRQVISQLELRRALKKIKSDFSELQGLAKAVIEQQEKIKSSEKLVLIGELTSGVSHEINNPLAIINSAAYIATAMIQKNEKSELVIHELEKISQMVMRLSAISKALKTISDAPAENFKDLKSVQEKFNKIMNESRKQQ